MQCDIVIPYLKNDSGELECCLNLIKQNVPHRQIHIAQDWNKVYRQGAIPHINVILKLKHLIETNPKLSEEFYLFNDDFFVMKPIDKIPYYYRSTMTEHRFSRKIGAYAFAIRNTLSWVGVNGLSYEMHIPMKMNKHNVMSLITEIERTFATARTPLIRSLYGNRFNVGGEKIPDVKDIPDFVDKTFLSTSEKSFKSLPIGEYIRQHVV